MRAAAVVALILIVSVPEPLSAEQVDLEAARQQFLKSCGTCHSVEPNAAARQGPNLLGVFGRQVGQVDGFEYSDTLAAGDWLWTEDALEPWIENAQKAHPGTTMNYRQRSAEKRALIIAYLKSLSPNN